MSNTWPSWRANVRPFQGRDRIGRLFRGFHPRLFTLFASGELGWTDDKVSARCHESLMRGNESAAMTSIKSEFPNL